MNYLTEFLDRTNLDDSLLLGFYGGGNYGDELLMETLAGLVKAKGAKNVTVAYQTPQYYRTYHHNFGFALTDIRSKAAMIKAIVRAKKLIVGGGGLWGMDFNFNVLAMSLALFAGKWLMGKKVYLLNVGYYDSAPKMGRLGAWLAGKAADEVLARDQQSYQNFLAVNKKTVLDVDIAWYIDRLDLAGYQKDLAGLEERVQIKQKTLLVTLRRFNGPRKHHLAAVVGQFLRSNPGMPVVVALMEPRNIDPDGYSLLQSWKQAHPGVQILDFSYNPMALLLFFRKYRDKLLLAGPQFHAILSAHLSGVPYLPLVYDNKVEDLLKLVAPAEKRLPLDMLRTEDLQRFTSVKGTA